MVSSNSKSENNQLVSRFHCSNAVFSLHIITFVVREHPFTSFNLIVFRVFKYFFLLFLFFVFLCVHIHWHKLFASSILY